MMHLNRIQPQGEVQHYQTYGISAGQDVAVVAACKDVGCQHWFHGWETVVDEASDLGKAQAHYIRTRSGRTFTEAWTGEGATVFRFEAFQRCFQDHNTVQDVFTRRHGDFRGNPSGQSYRHTSAKDWTEDFAENQMRLAEAKQKG